LLSIYRNIPASCNPQPPVEWIVRGQSFAEYARFPPAPTSVSKALPSLMRSQKLQQKAAKVGFDWESVDGALDKLKEEVAELEEAISENDSSHMQEELGDVLFSAVNIARFINADAENVLYNACEKFISRFSKMEQIARENNIVMDGASLETLDGLWEQAKK